MSARSAPLSPETMKLRKRQRIPRAPEESLRKKVGQPTDVNEELKDLLEQLLEDAKRRTYLAERETVFTMTLERARLESALGYAGFLGTTLYNYEGQIAPGATVTTYLPVPGGFVLSPVQSSFYSSLPWWLTVGIWYDSDLPAAPTVMLLRAPDRYDYKFEGMTRLSLFQRFTVTNNHAINTANCLAIQFYTIMTETTWKMMEEIYLKPIVEYAQKLAEEKTGRPFP